MEYQQDAFKQEFGYEMPFSICKRKVTDFVIRRYKKIEELTPKHLATTEELDAVQGLFWAVVQLKDDNGEM